MVLIDTSAWIQTLRRNGRAEVREKVEQLTLRGEAAVCEMVLLELWNGARGLEERTRLLQLQREISLLPVTIEVWELSFQLAQASRAHGLTVPSPDLLIAACARFYDVSIEHFDNHFTHLDKINLG